MDDTANKIHQNRMAVAGAGGAVAFLLFWLAFDWGFLGGLLAGIVVFALLLLLIGWIGADDAEAKPAVGTTQAASSGADSRIATSSPTISGGGAAAGGGAASATAPATTGTPLGEGVHAPADDNVLAAQRETPSTGSDADGNKPAPLHDASATTSPVTPTPKTVPEPLMEPARAPASPAVPVATILPETPSSGDSADKPEMLASPRNGKADDLKMIKGVGPKIEAACNDLGIWHYDQIASWTDAQAAWVDANLEGTRRRVMREDWVAQARVLANGGPRSVADRNDRSGVL